MDPSLAYNPSISGLPFLGSWVGGVDDGTDVIVLYFGELGHLCLSKNQIPYLQDKRSAKKATKMNP